MKEIWKDIKDYEGLYKVSNKGRVKSLRREVAFSFNRTRIIKEKILVPSNHYKGYLYIRLCKFGKIKIYKIHRLVGTMFIKNPKNKLQINHKDCNKSNNNVNNLEWNTNSENQKHAYKNKANFSYKGENSHLSKLKEMDVLEIRKKYNSGGYTQTELAKEYNCCITNIGRIIKNKSWAHI